MKKKVLALSIAAMFGGLGFVGHTELYCYIHGTYRYNMKEQEK